MANTLGLKAHHITGRVGDINAIVTWYMEILDLQLIERGELLGGRMKYAVLGLPGYSISFVQFDDPERGVSSGPAPIPHWVHPVFSVADPDATYRLLENKGVRLATHGPKPPIVKVFQLFDCEGNQIEIVADGAVH
jgi:catechol 2,3-dioxygenase-like lactoylglutathione lyase family enzyme